MPLEPLVSAAWLQKNLSSVAVLDGSYYLPTMGKDPEAEFQRGHIPGAMRWDIDEIAELSSDLNHMMPDPAVIAREAGLRGISSFSSVVVYDQLGVFSAARVWLAFKHAGHKNVAILNGGLPAWSGELATGPETRPGAGEYGDFSNGRTVVDRHAVLTALEDSSAQVLDARSAQRFAGTAPEPREGLRGGHMPLSINVPYTELLDETGKFKSRAALRGVFSEHGVTFDAPVITSCGSGVTAAVVTFALALLGTRSVVYDGSWSEWGQPELDMPVVSTAVSSTG